MQKIPIDEHGRFAGYASVFGRLDEGGDIVMPGAFGKSLTRRGRDDVRMLFQHDPKEPVGIWDRLAEDGFGLWAEGRLVAGVPRADALRRLIEARAIDGLSIGFRTVRATREAGTGHRRLWQVELWEISIVAFPMLDAARIAPAPPPIPASDGRLIRSLDAAITRLRQP
jgi:hypothetical protein